MFCYMTEPIDHWAGILTIEEYCSSIRADDFMDSAMKQDAIIEVQEDFKKAMALAREKGWEEDFSQGPFVFLLPNPEGFCMRYGFIWKQYNNGMTFIVSPFALPWIEEYM